jgi:hypothetical protein
MLALINMADARTCEVGVTLAPLNIGSSGDEWYLKNKQLLLRVLFVEHKRTKWWLHEICI